MTKHGALLLLSLGLALAGCDSDPATDAGVIRDAAMDSGAGEDDAGGGDEDAGRDAGGETGSDAGLDGGPEDAGPTDAGVCEDSPCRLVSPQCGCAAGEGCTLNDASERVCEPSGPGGEGADCSVDACQPGFVCGEGPDYDVCLRFCADDTDCVGGEGSRCLIDFGVARACTTACDPVANTGCPSGAGCTIVQTAPGSGDYFINCRPAGAAATGDVCGNELDCEGGNSCRSAAGPRRCTAWCRTDADCGSGETCVFELTVGTTTYGRCA